MESTSQHSSFSPIAAFSTKYYHTRWWRNYSLWNIAESLKLTIKASNHFEMAELLHVVGVQVPEESPLFPLNKKKKSADCHLSYSVCVPCLSSFLSPCDGRWPTRSFLPHPNNCLELQVFTFLGFLAAFELYYRNSSVMHNKSPEEAQYLKTGSLLFSCFYLRQILHQNAAVQNRCWRCFYFEKSKNYMHIKHLRNAIYLKE